MNRDEKLGGIAASMVIDGMILPAFHKCLERSTEFFSQKNGTNKQDRHDGSKQGEKNKSP